MASRALFRSWLVEENVLAVDKLGQLMALCATHVLVCSAQRELSTQFVIEQRRLPLLAGVALGTKRNRSLRELFSMSIFMAVLAPCRRQFEIDIDQIRLEMGRLVAVDARRRPVCAKKRKCCLGMIEARQILP